MCVCARARVLLLQRRRGWSPSASESSNGTREVQESAKRLCRESLQEEPGVAPAPSCALDPLNPPLSHFEYEDLERDRAKYFLYFAAILAACRQKLGEVQDDTPRETPPAILVLGAGHGRLVTLALEAAREALQGMPCSAPFSVEVLDANPEAIAFLRSAFRHRRDVTVHEAVLVGASAPKPPSVLRLRTACDIVVSEVFGSFGDNEFLPEISAEAAFFARPRAIIIPASWE